MTSIYKCLIELHAFVLFHLIESPTGGQPKISEFETLIPKIDFLLNNYSILRASN